MIVHILYRMIFAVLEEVRHLSQDFGQGVDPRTILVHALNYLNWSSFSVVASAPTRDELIGTRVVPRNERNLILSRHVSTGPCF